MVFFSIVGEVLFRFFFFICKNDFDKRYVTQFVGIFQNGEV